MVTDAQGSGHKRRYWSIESSVTSFLFGESVKIGLITPDEGMTHQYDSLCIIHYDSESECVAFIGNLVDLGEISEMLHHFKFGIHYHILNGFDQAKGSLILHLLDYSRL